MNRRNFLATGGAALGGALMIAPHAALAQRSGVFSGRTGHVASGHGTLTDMGVSLARNFWFDGAPDPRVGLGHGGTFDPATDMGALRRNTGAQLYGLPRHLDAAAYDTIVVWCRKFNVPLAVAAVG
ncbi:MAG: DM13 domain-containing protein [Pseudomonadota bacterium]